jgi:HEAT repeat protein
MKKANMTSRVAMTIIAIIFAAVSGSSLQAQTPPASSSLDQILKEISSYEGGIDSAPYWKLRDYVYARKDTPAGRTECETKLLEFLGTKATPVAKMAACRYLRLIGSDQSVPVLQGMLLEKATADMALYALQKIPGSAADRAILQTLSKTDGATKISVIAALGDRKCLEAIPALLPMLKANGEFSGAAALALGNIGGEAVANALVASLATAQADLKSVVAASIMRSAEGLVAAKRVAAASSLYEKLLAEKTLPGPIREAAMIGKISTAGTAAAAVILDQLKTSDPALQEAAISGIKDGFKPEAIGPVCSLLPGLPESSQVKILVVLAGYPRERVLPTVLQAAKSNAVSIRIAALQALETVGDASVIPFLVEAAAKSRGPEQGAARGALALIKGRPADDAVLSLLAGNPADDIQGEVLQAIAERRIYAAKGAVAGCLTSASSRIRIQALRTLRTIGTPSDLPTVLAFLLKIEDDAEQLEGTATAAALAQKIANPDGRSNAVKGMLTDTKDPKARARLCSLLGRIGDDSALPVLRTALAEPNDEVVDAAVRALASWTTPAARDDLVQMAQKSKDETHRLLALQGLLRMIRAERYRKPEAAVADLRLVYAISWRPDERRLILGILPNFACPEALELAGILLGEPALKAEAQAAIERIKTRLSNK